LLPFRHAELGDHLPAHRDLHGVFGFVAAGPVGLGLSVVFFALFIWFLVRDRASRNK
jgi:hypothetical protein